MNIARNGLLIFLSKIFAGAIIFLSQIILARLLGPEGFGAYCLFLTIVGVVFLFGGLGFGTAAIYLSNKKNQNFVQIFSNSIFFGVLWGIMLSLLVFLFSVFFPALFGGLSQKYIFIALITIPFVVLYNYCLSLLIAKFKIITWSVFTILYSALILTGSIVPVFFLKLGATGAIFSVFMTVLINFILIFLYLIKICGWINKVDIALLVSQLKLGASTYLGDIFGTINFKLNIFIVNIFLGVLSVGYYSVSYNIAAFIFIIPYSLQQVLYPAWSFASEEEVDQKTPRVARQAILFSFFAAILLSFFGRFFILFFYGRDFLPAITPFYLILPGGVCAAFAGIFFNNFFAKGKSHITSIILLFSLFVNIFFNIILIPQIGIAGAALAASISYFFAALAAVFIFRRMTKTLLKDVFFVRLSDLVSLYESFFHLFSSVGKILNEVSSRDVAGLKDYYEKRADAFDIIKKTFESTSLYKRIMYSTRVDKITSLLDIKEGDKVLEVGCGEGYYTKKILETSSNVVATDISQKFLEKAQKNTNGMARDYVCCPAEKLPFPDNYFDKVLMSEVIEHLLDWRVGVEEVRRVLKPGGILVISTPNKLSYFNVLCHIKILLRNNPLDGDHIKEFSRRELADLLKEYFVVEKFDYTNYFPFVLPSFIAEFVGFESIKKFMQFIEKILSSIFIVREFGLVFFIRAKKPK